MLFTFFSRLPSLNVRFHFLNFRVFLYYLYLRDRSLQNICRPSCFIYRRLPVCCLMVCAVHLQYRCGRFLRNASTYPSNYISVSTPTRGNLELHIFVSVCFHNIYWSYVSHEWMKWQRVGARRERKQKRCVGTRKGNVKRYTSCSVSFTLYLLRKSVS
jgi:hypothetical protein